MSLHHTNRCRPPDNLLIHRADGDDGTYTVTVTNLSWPDGRRAPDITVGQENPNNVDISWTKSKKSQSSLLAPPGNYEIEYRTLSGGSWSYAGTVSQVHPECNDHRPVTGHCIRSQGQNDPACRQHTHLPVGLRQGLHQLTRTSPQRELFPRCRPPGARFHG